MFCKFCGSQMKADAKFCPKCGKQKVKNETIVNNSKTQRTNKKITLITVIGLVLVCAILFLSGSKSPAELLKNNAWYKTFVDCEYYDWSYDDFVAGYYFSADCDKIVFHSDGKAEVTFYRTPGAGGERGPFASKINIDNMPPGTEWREVNTKNYSWELVDDDTLKYKGDYYSWDDSEETQCECDDYECKHEKTWYITDEYLRIGKYTYTTEKPSSFNIEIEQ